MSQNAEQLTPKTTGAYRRKEILQFIEDVPENRLVGFQSGTRRDIELRQGDRHAVNLLDMGPNTKGAVSRYIYCLWSTDIPARVSLENC